MPNRRAVQSLADHQEVTTLASAHGRRVFATAYRILGDVALAEDCQQAVFLKLLERGLPKVDSWPAYLTTMASRAAIDRLRRRQRWQSLLPEWIDRLVAADAKPDQAAEDDEQQLALRQALGSIAPAEAQCFSLRYFEGLAIAEIARCLSMSENHVSVTLHRATRSLRQRVAPAQSLSTEEA